MQSDILKSVDAEGSVHQVDPATRQRMQQVRRRDTAPELALRSELHRRGLRYFVDRPPLRGLRRRADLVFPRLRTAVYVDGCFWHCCPAHGSQPARNQDWWREKLAANVRRDRDTDRMLAEAGWWFVRVWEHEAPSAGADRVEAILTLRRLTTN
jgi:DNA mismatch endonuclease, patch repair protein